MTRSEHDGERADAGAVIPTGDDAVALRASAAEARAQLARRSAEVERQQAAARAEVERRRAELEADFAKQRAELEALMAPLKLQLEQMTEVMWTVDLYLGRDETLRLIRDGKPAPADTPLTIRQKVLVMAEESLVHVGASRRGVSGMDADDLPDFITWLTEDDENLDRVLPEQKGVVVLVPTRVHAKSGNLFEDTYRDAENQRSYWLLRSGERLHLLTVDPQLRIFDRVLPRRREFVEVFDQRLFGFGRASGEPVRPGSDEWLQMEATADAKRRHYMRILLVLQGLLDRTTAFHPLPVGGLNLLSLADQDAGRIVLLQDDEDSIQLGDGGETFADYQRRLNGLLRPGLRVIGNWHTTAFADLRRDYDGSRGREHPRLHPPTVGSLPASDVPHLIEGRRDGGYVIRFDRTDEVWRRNVPVPGKPGYVYPEYPVTPTQRASCVVQASDSWVLPFDLVTVPELERFLTSRQERSKHFLTMVPTIRAALAAKHAEAEQESAFRGLLAALLVAEDVDADDAPALVDEYVHWWKLHRTWTKPLNGDGAHERKAATEIVAEHRSRTTAIRVDADAIIAAGRRLPNVIAVARDRRGRWHAYTPSPGAHEDGTYLDVTRIYADGRIGATAPWQLLTHRSAAALHIAWQLPQWSDWTFGLNPRRYLTGPERDALTDQLRDDTDGAVLCITELFDPHDDARTLGVYAWTGETPPAHAAATAQYDALDQHGAAPVDMHAWRVVKGRDGAITRTPGRHWRIPRAFSSFSVTTRWGHLPWWPDDAHDYGDHRPRRIWVDEPLLDDVATFRDRCRALHDAARDERRSVDLAAQRYVPGIQSAIVARQHAQARARFDEDFGTDAADLWPKHIETLDLASPIHQRTLWGLVAIALEHDHPIVGQTLDALADHALTHANRAPGEWHPGRGRIDLAGYGDIVVPEPNERG